MSLFTERILSIRNILCCFVYSYYDRYNHTQTNITLLNDTLLPIHIMLQGLERLYMSYQLELSTYSFTFRLAGWVKIL